jgi:predicted oxidoreductase
MTVPQLELSHSGPRVSRIIPGLMRLMEWQMDAPALLNWIEAVMDMGITSFDHADIYGSYQSEGLFGQALALKPSLRQQMQLITKCDIKLLSPNRPDHTVHSYDTSRAHIMQSVENSLKNLHTDYLDVLLIHRPDPLMDADEVAAALNELETSGKVLHFGVSNFPPHTYELLRSRYDGDLVTNQVEFSVMHLDPLHDGTFDQCQRYRIAPMVWSPVGGGGLFTGQGEQERRLRAELEKIGHEVGATVMQVALAFVMMPPSRPVPVLGTGKLERIRESAEAVDVKLTRDQWFRIWQASTGHEVP